MHWEVLILQSLGARVVQTGHRAQEHIPYWVSTLKEQRTALTLHPLRCKKRIYLDRDVKRDDAHALRRL